MRRYILLVVAVLVVASLVACNPSCPKKTTTAFLEDYDALLERWDDANELAGSTARISLAPQVTRLQDIKNDVDDLEDVCKHVRRRG
jgi:hypothetical protein